MMSRVKKERLKKGSIFVPLIFSFGAKLEDLPMETFLHDPTKVSNALRTIQNYFRTDGIFTYGDGQLLPEALGCVCRGTAAVKDGPVLNPDRADDVERRLDEILQHERVSIAIEVTKRLNMLLPDTLLAGLLTGPVTLATRLTGVSGEEALGQPKLISLTTKAALTFTRALGDTGIDILIVSEDALPPIDANLARVLPRVYSPIWNTAKYYGFPALLMVREFSTENVAALRRVVDGLVFPADTEPEIWRKLRKVSFSMPVSVMEKSPEEVTAYLVQSGIDEARQGSSLFLVTTDAEIPASVHKESMIRGIQTIRDHLRGA
jgi:hypothetical protein